MNSITGYKTARKPILKFQNMTRKKLKEFLLEYPTGVTGEQLGAIEKVDGQAYRIGCFPTEVENEYDVTFESAYSGPQVNPLFFTDERLRKASTILHQTMSVKTAFESLAKSHLEKGFKLVGELIFDDSEDYEFEIVVTRFSRAKTNGFKFVVFSILDENGNEFSKDESDAIIYYLKDRSSLLHDVLHCGWNLSVNFEAKWPRHHCYDVDAPYFNKSWKEIRQDLYFALSGAISREFPTFGAKYSIIEGAVFDFDGDKIALTTVQWYYYKKQRDEQLNTADESRSD